ncbi:Type-3 glutamine synthetase [uncultured delta proteobacterium]|uniref:Type-3 glutamine synthetase n=1 Tax=uncultured delta proteobacterium TaxID=34034 RepID=A0A212JVS5_9DELT|nr:Type-3 glutamine synthetase [uncultured delta proteobacterium]
MSYSLRNAVRLSLATEAPATNPTPQCGATHMEIFGRDVFGLRAMRQRLPKQVFARLEQAIEKGEGLHEGDADVVASAMKDWAIEKGASHYTHWFQPMTGLTAEKHDAFLTPAGRGDVIYEFSGKTLVMGEPDASSFPSGGIRSTFEARGYTAWDPTSPAFILANERGKTLYIPTMFVSYTGESLDRKTPLIRSLKAVSEQALRILRLFGNATATHVTAMAGVEQEYFLVDKRLFKLRADLMLAGRTIYGFKSSKGQELEDQYFGSINPRVLAFMAEMEEHLFALGIPAHTRHNEVAPNQFEFAPVYEPANIATDHNMLSMQVMKSVAERHGFACLLHEKPFAGVNGSGKHNNWSLCDSDGNNLFDPGKTPWDNVQFLVFLAAVLRATHKHAAAIRLATVGAGNDHRLGANEAPPAILSIFLGDQVTQIIESIAKGNGSASGVANAPIELGVTCMPPLPKDVSDRNRTSSLAFTGNKFEFRAVGSSMSVAPANTVLNTAMANALNEIATELETSVGEGMPLTKAVQSLLERLFREHMPVVFNGNGYTEEWQQEAARRGLPNYRDTVTALSHYTDPEVMDVFLSTNVLSERELLARQEILLETYIRHIHVEAKLAISMGRSVILPAAMKALKDMAEVVASVKAMVPDAKDLPEETLYHTMRGHVHGLMKAVEKLDADHEKLDAMTGTLKRAEASRDILVPAMAECRAHADALEAIMDDALWPLPKYGELLWNHC